MLHRGVPVESTERTYFPIEDEGGLELKGRKEKKRRKKEEKKDRRRKMNDNLK